MKRRAMGWAVVLGLGLGLDFPLGATASEGERPRTQVESLQYDPMRRTWVEEGPPVPGTPEGDLALARADFSEKRYSSAYGKIRKWLKTYGESHPLYPDAAVLRARIEMARRDYYKAHKHLQAFLNQYSGTHAADEAIQYEFVIAEVFLKGTKRKLLGLPILPAEDLGVRILDDLGAAYPESTIAELALKTKADYFFRKGEFSLAEMEYARLREQFSRSRYVRYALRRSADAALASFPGVEFDDAPLIEAEARFREYLTQYPGAAEQEGVGLILEEVREKRAAKELNIGDYYRRTKHSQAAAYYYRSTVTHWPETLAARKATALLANMGLNEGPEVARETDVTHSAVGEPPGSEEGP